STVNTPTFTATPTDTATATPTATATITATGTPPTSTPTVTPTPPPPTSTLIAAIQNPRYSVAPNGPDGCDPADILTLPFTIGTSSLFASAGLLGLTEGPPNDNLDALAWPEAGQTSTSTVFFTLAPSSPSLARIGATSADILTRNLAAAGGPSIGLSRGSLGL